MAGVPKKLQAVLWSRNVVSLDLKKDKNYIIHQLLMFGSLGDINWLKTTYSEDDIRKTFAKKPRKIYTESAYNFIKNYLLNIKKKLPKSKYVKTTSRNIK